MYRFGLVSGNLPPISIHIAGWVVFPCIQLHSTFYLIKFFSYNSVSTCVLVIKFFGLTIVLTLRMLPPISIHIAGWVVFPYVQTVPVSIHIAWDLSICNIFLFICNIFCVYNILLFLVLDMTLNCLLVFACSDSLLFPLSLLLVIVVVPSLLGLV